MWRCAAILGVCLHLAMFPSAAIARQVVEWSTHEPTGVRSAWLANGARVHHKRVGEKDENVVVTIRLIGGALEEDEHNRGITQAAMAAWKLPRTFREDADQFAERLEAADITLEGGIIEADMIGVALSCPTRALGEAIRAGAELVADPWIDQPTLDAWKEEQRSLITARRTDADGMLRELVAQELFPGGDARVRPLELEDVDRLDLDEVRAWLELLTSSSPIEIGIAGPVGAARAMELAGDALGSLPARPRIARNTHAKLRTVAGERPRGPIVGERLCPSCRRSIGFIGFYATDRRNTRDTEGLFTSILLLNERFRSLEWEVEPEPDVAFLLLAGRAFPGYGMLYARVDAAPEQLDRVIARVEKEIDAFATSGPTPSEIDGFHVGAREEIEKFLGSPGFWSSRLALNTSIGDGLHEIGSLLENYTTISAEDIRECFARYAVPTNRFRLLIRTRPEGTSR